MKQKSNFIERFGRNIRRNGLLGGFFGGGESVTHGGIVNPKSGMGLAADKAESSYFQPTRIYSKWPLEVFCVQSWAARKAVSIKPRDMFLKTREWSGIDPDRAAQVERVYRKWQINRKIMDLMICANQYGTGLMVFMTTEAPLHEPLNVNQIRPGDLKAIRIFSRFEASVLERQYDLFEENYARPEYYHIHPIYARTTLKIHHSRVLRMDGIIDSSDSNFHAYEQDWGVPLLVPLIQTILHEAGLAQGVVHMTQEASIPILEIENLREVTSQRGPDEMSAEEIGSKINEMKSIYRLLMLDKGSEEFKRSNIPFGGVADLFDKSARRIAAGIGVPFTWFMGDSPKGLNATGDGDFRNYIMTLESERQDKLPFVFDFIDEIVFRSAGLGNEIPDWTWPSLLDLTEIEETQKALNLAQALERVIQSGLVDEDEGRAMLQASSLFGTLVGPAPEPAEDLDDVVPSTSNSGAGV